VFIPYAFDLAEHPQGLVVVKLGHVSARIAETAGTRGAGDPCETVELVRGPAEGLALLRHRSCLRWSDGIGRIVTALRIQSGAYRCWVRIRSTEPVDCRVGAQDIGGRTAAFDL